MQEQQYIRASEPCPDYDGHNSLASVESLEAFAEMLLRAAVGGDLASTPLEKRLDCVNVATSALLTVSRRHHHSPVLPPNKLQELTRRQREILMMLDSGKTPAMIAAELHLSRRTVEWHIRNLRQAFGKSTYKGVIRAVRAWPHPY